MDKEFINGKMEENILEIIKMIKSMDLENITGMMGECLKAIGLKERDQVKEGLFIQMEQLNLGYGKMIKEWMMKEKVQEQPKRQKVHLN